MSSEPSRLRICSSLRSTALGADPARSVALEDSHHGCTAAKAAGMVCVVVPNEVTRSQSFDHADLVVDSLAEVSVDLLQSLLPV